MRTLKELKYKFILLIILAIAVGALILTIPKKTVSKQTATNNNPKVAQEKKTMKFDCNTYQKKTIAKNLKEGDIDLTNKSCLYVGCGGFTY